MGQMANGILYGCEAPSLPDDEDGEKFYDITQRWENANGISGRDHGAKMRIEGEGDKRLVGVWVAVGGSGEDDAPYFVETCIPLDQVPIVYAEQIAKVKLLWDRFVIYAAQRENIQLPAATLWLTPCEVA